MRKYICGLALAFLLSAAPAYADLQGSLLNEYSASAKGNTYTITDSNVKKIDDILADSKANIICWQVAYENYDEAFTPKLLDWVRQGGSLWFYDARLADRFGMEMYELRGDQFRGKPENGDVGEVKTKGMAVTVMPIQGHAVGTGVASVAVFLPLIDEQRNVYGSIIPHEGTDNLLQFAADSPAISALRREGYGTVVFKPLLWEKTLSGERFQRNLIDFCAGYGVPGVGGEGRVGEILSDKKNFVQGTAFVGEGEKPAVDVTSKAEVKAQPAQNMSRLDASIAEAREAWNNMGNSSKDNDSSSAKAIDESQDRMYVAGEKEPRCGTVITKEIIFEGGSESCKFKSGDLRRLEIGQGGSLDTATLADGRVMRGFVMNFSLDIQTEYGKYTCKKGDLKYIDFHNAQER